MSRRIYAELYLRHNLGDDLFLVALSHRYPEVELLVPAGDGYGRLLSRLPNVTPVPDAAHGGGRGPISKASALRRRTAVAAEADCVAFVGGSIFMEPTAASPARSLVSRQVKCESDKALLCANDHAFVLGANFGPYSSPSFPRFYRRLFGRHCEDVCFRDTASGAIFEGLPNVRTAPDLLFSTRFPAVEKTSSALLSVVHLGNAEKFPGLGASEGRYLSWMFQSARACEARGLIPVVASFSAPEGDEVASDRLCKLLEREGIRHERLDYHDDPNEVLTAIASSSIVVGTRFHATVLALAAGVPSLPVIYSDKTSNMLHDLGFDMGRTMDVRRLGKGPAPAAEDLVEATLGAPPPNLSRHAMAAEGHFRALDAFLS